MNYQTHEYANLFPMMDAQAFAELKADIQDNGLLEPVVLYQEKVLDGRNRYKACNELGIEPRFITVNGNTDPLKFVISKNLKRRHLDTTQRAVVAARLANMREGGDKRSEKYHSAKFPSGISQPAAAEMLNVSDRTLRTVKSVMDQAPDLVPMMESGEMSATQAYREVVRRNVKEAPPAPEGKYRVIYADPPWQYGNTMPDTFTEQRDHYPTMTLPEICALPIKDMAEDNAVLFLWVTSPILEESFEVIKAWGFKYKASFVWDKDRPVMGHYNSVQHELLLVCVRGSCTPDMRPIKLFDSVQTIKRTEHSRKPDEFRGIIDKLYPSGKRIELFARSTHDGWDAWGNQVT